jgi:hypothetical protein
MTRRPEQQRPQRRGSLAILAAVGALIGAQALAPDSARALQTDNCTDAYGFAVPCQDAGGGSGADGGGAEEGDSADGTGGDAYGGESYGDVGLTSPDAGPARPASPAIGPQSPTETWTTWTYTGHGDYSGIKPWPDWKSWTATNVMCPNLLPQLRDLTYRIDDDLDAIDDWNTIPSDGVTPQLEERKRKAIAQIRKDVKEQARKRARAKVQWRFWDCEAAFGVGGD